MAKEIVTVRGSLPWLSTVTGRSPRAAASVTESETASTVPICCRTSRSAADSHGVASVTAPNATVTSSPASCVVGVSPVICRRLSVWPRASIILDTSASGRDASLVRSVLVRRFCASAPSRAWGTSAKKRESVTGRR